MHVQIEIRAMDGSENSLHLARLVNETMNRVESEIRSTIQLPLDKDEVDLVVRGLMAFKVNANPQLVSKCEELEKKIYELRQLALERGGLI